jgi:hypothetical protein
MNTSEIALRQRVKICTWLFIIGLIFSGATAMPLLPEMDLVVKWLGLAGQSDSSSGFAHWILKVHAALIETDAKFPFLAYAADWLAFGHFMIALVFVGALRDPVRNAWLFTFGLIACVLVLPFAFIMGALRGIPIYWRLIDCSFGVIGFVPMALCRRWVKQIEDLSSRRQ